MGNRYLIKIFSGTERFDNSGEYLKNDTDVVISIYIASGIFEFLHLKQCVDVLKEKYQGVNYCVIDLFNDEIVISGTLDYDDLD